MLLASSVDSENDLPTQVRLSRLAIDANDSECVRIVDFCYIERDFSSDNITCIKFSPDGEKIFVTIYRQVECRRGAWLRMFEVPDNLWSKKSEMGKVELAETLACDEENAQNRYAENNDLQKISEKADEKEAFGSRAENPHQIDHPFYLDKGKAAEGLKLENDVNKGYDGAYVIDTKENVEREIDTKENVKREEETVTYDRETNAEQDAGSDLSDEISGRDHENKTQSSESDESDTEINRARHEVYLDCYELDVISQGFSVPPSPPESSSDSDREFYTDEEYYDWRYSVRTVDESNLFTFASGFYCLAISPDTTRLLTGNHDGEVFITDEESFAVLQHIQAHENDTVVSGCHYNPVYGHDEFATCGGGGTTCPLFKIWRVTESDSGDESASCVNSLPLISRPASCCYSPDGNLVAVSCDNALTYIICARSCVMIFILGCSTIHPRILPCINQTSFSSTVFGGRTCQVITTPNRDNLSIAVWNLPVIYSLETLSLLVIRATKKYCNIDALHLPESLKLRIKYLYV